MVSHFRQTFAEFVATLPPGIPRPKLVPLKIANAYHSSLLAPEQNELSRAVDQITNGAFQDPDTRVYSPMLRGWVATGRQARQVSIDQLTAPVHYAEAVRRIIQEVHPVIFATSDPKGTTDDLIRQNLQEIGMSEQIQVVNFSTPERLEQTVRILEVVA